MSGLSRIPGNRSHRHACFSPAAAGPAGWARAGLLRQFFGHFAEKTYSPPARRGGWRAGDFPARPQKTPVLVEDWRAGRL